MLEAPKVLGTFEVMEWRPPRCGISVGIGRDTTLNRQVTLVRLESGATAAARNEFLTAARRLAGGRHRSLATVLDVVEEDDAPYMVLESSRGGTLQQWLTFFPPSTSDALRLGIEIAEGLRAACTLQLLPVVLESDSIWIDRGESSGPVTRPEVRLLLFRPLESVTAVPQDAEFVNSLGQLLFAMLTGGRVPDSKHQPPFRALAPQVSHGVARLISQLLAADQGWTLETAARRMAQWQHASQRRPLGWLASGVVLGVAAAYAFLGKVEDSKPSDEAPHQPSPPPVITRVVAPQPAVVAPLSETPALSETVVQPVSLPPLNSQTEFEPLSPGWSEFVVTLPPRLLVEAVGVELRRRNPGFDGDLHDVEIRGGHVRGFWLPTDLVRDITPVAVLKHLEWIGLAGKSHRSGKLESLQPLRGLPLREIRAGWTRVRDLTPLTGMPLKVLRVGGTRVEDITPLQGLPLVELELWSTSVHDISPLAGMLQLQRLRLMGTNIVDLAPLAELPLTYLDCKQVHVKDWTPLGKLPLKSLDIDLKTADQRELLRGIKSLELLNGKPVGESLNSSDI